MVRMKKRHIRDPIILPHDKSSHRRWADNEGRTLSWRRFATAATIPPRTGKLFRSSRRPPLWPENLGTAAQNTTLSAIKQTRLGEDVLVTFMEKNRRLNAI